MSKNLRQQVSFKAAPHEVYDTLMGSRKHAAFTGEKARISRNVGGRFTCYDGYITGFNLHLEPDRRIVQAWRGSDWPAGAYSIADFALTALPGGGTRLTFVQAGVPDAQLTAIRRGWIDYYWKPMKAVLGPAGGARGNRGPGRKK